MTHYKNQAPREAGTSSRARAAGGRYNTINYRVAHFPVEGNEKVKKDLFDLSAEINGAAMIILGLSNQLDNKESDSLTPGSLKDALFGIAEYLERIVDDLNTK